LSSPIELDKFAALLWFMTSAPIEKLRDGTLQASDFPGFSSLQESERSAFEDVLDKMQKFADDLEATQKFISMVLKADSALWTTDHFLIPGQIVRIARLQQEQVLRLTREARQAEYDSKS
jgi:hypothetical protein